MFEEINNIYGITLGELREYINNNLKDFSDNIKLNFCVTNTDKEHVEVKQIIADEDSVTFYDI